MPDRRAAAISRLSDRLGAHAAQAVAYSRAGGTPLAIMGTLTNASSEGETPKYGAAAGLDLSNTDLIVKLEDLGELGLPKLADKVETTINGDTHEFSVSKDLGEDVYRFVDPMQTMVRIHLTHIGEVSP